MASDKNNSCVNANGSWAIPHLNPAYCCWGISHRGRQLQPVRIPRLSYTSVSTSRTTVVLFLNKNHTLYLCQYQTEMDSSIHSSICTNKKKLQNMLHANKIYSKIKNTNTKHAMYTMQSKRKCISNFKQVCCHKWILAIATPQHFHFR